MKRTLRIVLCFVVSLVTLYVIGFGWLMGDMTNGSQILWLFAGASSLLTALLTLLWELYLHGRERERVLTLRLDALEAELKGLKRRDEAFEE